MSDRPDDITKEAWEAAAEVADVVFDASVDLYETGSSGADPQLVIARAIDQARREGYAAGVRAAAEVAAKDHRSALALKVGYKPDWFVYGQRIANAIRALDGKGDGS